MACFSLLGMLVVGLLEKKIGAGANFGEGGPENL